jgi:hypothetical protein
MYTGKQNLQKRGVMSRFNGEERLHLWKGDECNRIDGTDGSMFPPNLVKRNSTIYIFSGDSCRRFPLQYMEDITVRAPQFVRPLSFIVLFASAWYKYESRSIAASPSLSPD